MEKENIINQVIEELSKIKGIGHCEVLSDEDRRTISEMEAKADEMTLMGLGRGDNKGVKEVLKSDVLLVFTTDMDYEWPPAPNVILMQDGEVVGEDTDDEDKLKEYAESNDALVMGNIVIYNKCALSSMGGKCEPLVVVLPPKKCTEVECLPEISSAHLASPSPPTDEFLKERICQSNECGSGTFLLGFDIINDT
ncbi:hypothetical protein J2755_001840 [Methanohalophilus levihalophilus]|uniref:hypothetical protein n=1 Tax=Methanohalophilus levihalophilus TaxID=1431282 RepID=UPI001AE8E374|nr:hypothetical protein [Methanohalophilus levihalophilus]MBP2030892.1 hypothetical protein [Methanohalophilus levihalophilus]